MRKTLKRIGQCAGGVLALRYLLLYVLERPIVGRQRAFADASAAIAKATGLLGVYTRQAFYRTLCQHVGDDVHFGFMTVFSKPELCIGDRVYFGNFCQIGLARIGDDCLIADGVRIPSGRHQHATPGDERTHQTGEATAPPMRPGPRLAVDDKTAGACDGAVGRFGTIRVGRGTWIGTNAVVMAELGDRVTVGAGAVVVEAVRTGERVGGVPARPLAHREPMGQAA